MGVNTCRSHWGPIVELGFKVLIYLLFIYLVFLMFYSFFLSIFIIVNNFDFRAIAKIPPPPTN